MTDESHNGIVDSPELENDLPPHPDGPENHGEEEFDSRYVSSRLQNPKVQMNCLV